MRYWTAKPEDGAYVKANGSRQKDNGEWINTSHTRLHRLAAVAWFGYDAVADWDVHHRISIPWLNIESNLVPLPRREHQLLTGKIQSDGYDRGTVEDVTEAMGDG